MPNWCENVVVIDGPVEMVNQLRESVSGSSQELVTALSLRQIVTPSGDSTDYNIAAWGTKWDVEAQETVVNTWKDRRDNKQYVRLMYTFDSAWSPPTIAIQKLSEKFPGVFISHSYDEQGIDFGGFQCYVGGRVWSEDTGASRNITWHDIAENHAESFDGFPVMDQINL